MPELPEVEVITQGLRPLLIGRSIRRIDYDQKRLRLPVEIEKLRDELLDQEICAVERRAKYIEIHLRSGAMLIVHLGMTGNLGVFPAGAPLRQHDHIQWTLDDARQLRYHDMRRFGSIQILSHKEAPERENTVFRTCGPEPFSEDFSGSYLKKCARKRKIAVKPFIMDTQVVVGIGNIYASESLFLAGLRPDKAVNTITKKQWHRLVLAIREVLTHAIACGGSTISDFLNASQGQGYFQLNFTVYGRDGSPCPRCDSILEKTRLAGRASYFCPVCQR